MSQPARTEMATLRCAVVGKEEVFQVCIEANQDALDLADLITENKNMDVMKLFLAKKGGDANGDWMVAGEQQDLQLSDVIKSLELDPTVIIADLFRDLGDSTETIHVLIFAETSINLIGA